MEMYNTGLRNGGLTNAGILNAAGAAADVCAVLPDQHSCRRTLAARLAARLAVPREWPFAAVLARSAMTVCVMCPAMSYGYGDLPAAGDRVGALLVQTVVCNFPWRFSGRSFSAVRWCGGCSSCWCPPRRLYRLCGRGGGMRDMCKRSRTLVRPGPLAIIPPGCVFK